ncbi:MAG TPA: DoxX family membrane protein [Candidatus Limnocylindrales bacterium]|nr:DoxX family membrane protein [Candidatus Limnocylindrales bacterium]
MNLLFLLGRIIFGGYFILSGLNHFKNLPMLSGYAQSKGTPAPSAAVIVSGIMILLGGLSILLGTYPVVGIILIIAFLVPVSFIMHNFWAVEDQQMKMADMINFTKNMALVGAALMFLAIPRPWPLSIALGE